MDSDLFQRDDPEYESLMAELRELFLRDTPPRLVATRQAIAARDAVTLGRQAHSLKGSCAQLEAGIMTRVSAQIEDCAQNSSFELAESLIRELEQEFERVRAAWGPQT